MDIRAYIQSGIIEQYVLGMATAEEVAELEQLCAEYPELNDAILSFEKQLETHLLANPVQPPAFIKSSLEKQLFGKTTAAKIAVENNTPVYNIGLWKYLAAACIILLLVSTALNFYFYSGYKNSKEQYEALLTQKNTLQANNVVNKTILDSTTQAIQLLQTKNKSYKEEITAFEQSFKIMHDLDVKEIKLKGILDKSNLATIYWDTKSKEVYFFRNHLKETPAGKQYQLWAIVHGKPVSAGLIGTCNSLCKMDVIPEAEAFAVTLEKEGGSTKPTLTEMYLLGKS